MAIIFVAIVMVIGGVFGVMNTMFAAISGRTKDIGVLRIIGFARWQILAVCFFLEKSPAILLVGGPVAAGLGYLTNGWTATSIVSGGQGGWRQVRRARARRRTRHPVGRAAACAGHGRTWRVDSGNLGHATQAAGIRCSASTTKRPRSRLFSPENPLYIFFEAGGQAFDFVRRVVEKLARVLAETRSL